ncbi:MAG: Gfo/Idh/MocA family oxidoreductase [Chloroflexota bacterium]|nr:Gfo/Idh/MocA family oxidoreductase [Chloroflexota bacterium]
MDRVRWGLLSTADINKEIIPAIRASSRSSLVAVASRNQETATAYAKKWEIPVSFGSYQDMLDSDKVDAVYIGLPNHLHSQWTVKTLLSGKHVLCEKPFALTTAEVDQMIEAKNKTGLVLAEAFMYTHHPQTKLATQWVRDGCLGDISLVRAVHCYKMINRDGNIRLIPEYGGGSLWDVGVYPLSFVQRIMGGLPERVSAEQYIGETGVDEVFVGQLHYRGGKLAQISSSFLNPSHTQVEVFGTEGRLSLSRPFVRMDRKRKMFFHPADGTSQEIHVTETPLYLGEIEDMNDAILDGSSNFLTIEESRNHVLTAVALYKAAETGTIVSL